MKIVLWLSVGAALLSISLVGVGRAQGQPTVNVAANSAAGPILTDPDGWTLYTWDGDEPGESYCYDQCAAVWPPLLIGGDPVAPADLPGTLGVIERDDGTTQVTFNDWPLYYFARDIQPGDTNGAGSAGFGALWHVVPAGVATAPVAQLPPPAMVQTPPTTVPPPVPAPTSRPAPPPTQQARTVTVTIADFEFRPPTLNVQVGDTVSWTNNGPSPHTATGDSGMWDTGRLNPGQSGSYTPTTAGTLTYRCAIHPAMRGTIVVGGGGGTTGGPSPRYGGQSEFSPGGTSYGGYMPQYRAYGSPNMGYPGGYGYSNMMYPGGYSYPGPGLMYPYGMPYQYPVIPPTVRLPAPTGLVVTATISTTVTLQWAPSPGAVSYQVHQALAPVASGAQPVLTGLANTTATVTGLAPTTTYYFHVHAVDGGGNLSPPSNIVAARTNP